MILNELYVQHDVWRRTSDAVCIRYIVLMHLESGKFAVQSADFFDGLNGVGLDYFNKQFIELMKEESPLERCEWFRSIEDAVRAHDDDFSKD